MSAADVIAQGLHAHDCGCADWVTGDDDLYYDEQAAVALAALTAAGYVVATREEIRAMTPTEQAELIGGEVEEHEWWDLFPQAHVVGPWVEVQP